MGIALIPKWTVFLLVDELYLCFLKRINLGIWYVCSNTLQHDMQMLIFLSPVAHIISCSSFRIVLNFWIYQGYSGQISNDSIMFLFLCEKTYSCKKFLFLPSYIVSHYKNSIQSSHWIDNEHNIIWSLYYVYHHLVISFLLLQNTQMLSMNHEWHIFLL